MAKQITVGFNGEGSTDEHFLTSIIQRTFEDVALECKGETDVLPVQYIKRPKSQGIEKSVVEAARRAEQLGLFVLCVHVDADDRDDQTAFAHHIQPAFSAVQATTETVCKNLVAIVPVQMTEAWMLADKGLLKNEIGTSKSDQELGLHRQPESFSDPKKAIEEAIRTALRDETQRKRQQFGIGDLYTPIGQKISLDQLSQLPSYQKFKEAVRGAYRYLNYLH